MVVSMSKLTRGQGLKYLLSSIARGDGAVDLSSPLTRYYAESGTPPGRFIGAGLASVDGGRGVASGTQVTATQLRNMLEIIGDPITGEPLGHRAEAVADDMNKVAAFDLTFSVPKSISVMWALADAGTQAIIYQAHLDAIAAVIAYAEKHVFFSRSGTAGVVQEPIEGVIAAMFDHWDSRAGDPQLHTHVIVENIARSLSDGQWRTLDSAVLYRAVVALSEMHVGIMEDLVADRLGVAFEDRQRDHSKNPKHEVAGVPDALCQAFSRRSTDINTETDRLIAEYRDTHGRHPTPATILQLRAQATLSTRPDKHHHSLAELTAQWRDTAEPYIGPDPVGWVHNLPNHTAEQAAEQAAEQVGGTPEGDVRLRLDDFTDDPVAQIAAVALRNVTDKKPTFTRANLIAEIHRQMQGWRFDSATTDRTAAADLVADFALSELGQAAGYTVQLTPPERHHVPERLRTAEGESKLVPASSLVFTTPEVLAAEQRLLDLARRTTGPRVDAGVVAAVAEKVTPGQEHAMSLEQAYTVEQIVTSGRVVDVLVGPAGAGKSSTMAGLRAVWERVYGPGSVVGLAPSSAAAEVLAGELGISTDNTAMWLTQHFQVNPERRRDLNEQLELAHAAPTEDDRARHLAAARRLNSSGSLRWASRVVSVASYSFSSRRMRSRPKYPWPAASARTSASAP